MNRANLGNEHANASDARLRRVQGGGVGWMDVKKRKEQRRGREMPSRELERCG